tara:strand:- start:47 stop:226 length:180 start_codon:yes stop_codon:yes gene_type:complete
MKITSAKYCKNPVSVSDENSNIRAVIDGITMFVPITTDNRHYRAIQEWVAEGNKIEEAD